MRQTMFLGVFEPAAELKSRSCCSSVCVAVESISDGRPLRLRRSCVFRTVDRTDGFQTHLEDLEGETECGGRPRPPPSPPLDSPSSFFLFLPLALTPLLLLFSSVPLLSILQMRFIFSSLFNFPCFILSSVFSFLSSIFIFCPFVLKIF